MKTRIRKFFKGLFFILLLNPSVYARQLILFNWSDYLPAEVIRLFENETGIEVRLSAYESNEAMYTKLKILNSGGYDLVFPSTYFVSRMIKENMLRKVDLKRIPNIVNMNPRLQGLAHDPLNQYSIPYLFGFTIMAYNSKKHPAFKTWNELWNIQQNRPLLMLDDMRESFAVALKSLGYSSNSTNPSEVKQAFERLVQLKPYIKLFTSETPKSSFVGEEISVGMIYNGDLVEVQKANSNVKAVLPDEGFTLWLDSIVMPRRAKNVDEAYEFLDFICRPEIAAKVSQASGYSSPNRNAVNHLPAELRSNPLMNPTTDVIDQGELLMDIGRSTFLYEDLWQRLKVIQ